MRNAAGPSRHFRENILLTLFLIVAGGVAFAVTVALAGGYLLSLVAALCVMLLVGLINYLLWGRDLTQEVHVQSPNSPPRTKPNEKGNPYA